MITVLLNGWTMFGNALGPATPWTFSPGWQGWLAHDLGFAIILLAIYINEAKPAKNRAKGLAVISLSLACVPLTVYYLGMIGIPLCIAGAAYVVRKESGRPEMVPSSGVA